MKKKLLPILLVTLLPALFGACSSSKKTQKEISDARGELVQVIVPDTFVLPVVPETLTLPEERAKFVVMHYWDRFDFSNRELVQRPEITEQALADYINILSYVPEDNADASLLYTLEKASVDTMAYRHITSLFDKYLYDPNSPFRNEEYYLSVLQEVMQSPLVPPAEKTDYAFRLEMVKKNRPGEKAANFYYTLASGRSYALYELQSEYTLLIFSNPGCHTCRSVMEYLERSEALNRALSMNNVSRTMLTVLTVYPDKQLEEWTAHLSEMPDKWLHGYDKGTAVTKKKLYDLRAIPTLYLLDKDKKVILKDASMEAVEAFFSASH